MMVDRNASSHSQTNGRKIKAEVQCNMLKYHTNMVHLPRRVEAAVGRRLFQVISRKLIKDAGLVHRTCVLPSGIPVSYYERGNERDCKTTILFCHGLTDEAKNFAGFIKALDLDDSYRILVPDFAGHGHDKARAFSDSYKHPSPTEALQMMFDFLLAVNVQECHAFGYSLGGAVVYSLKQQAPNFGVKIRRTVLLTPSLRTCIDKQFIDDFMNGRKNHFCFESRDDVKYLFRDLTAPNSKRKNPIPKFFLEAIFREQKETTPNNHFRSMFQMLLEDNDPAFAFEADVDPQAERLVIWPEHDFICSFERGRNFFRDSPPETTVFHSLPNCGHMFLAEGAFILDHIAPMVSDYLQRGK